MIGYRGKKAKRRLPPMVDSYADERYAAARVALVESLEKVRQLEQELEAERSRPRVGCGSCRHTGVIDYVDAQTGEVARIICPACADTIDTFIERYVLFYNPLSIGI